MLFGGYFGGSIQVLPAHDVSARSASEFTARRLASRCSAFVLPLWLAAAGVLRAWVSVLKRPDRPTRCASASAGCTRVLVNKYYFDWFNENVICGVARGPRHGCSGTAAIRA